MSTKTGAASQARAHRDRAGDFVDMLHEALMTALEDADTHGLFDGETCARFVTIADSPDGAALARDAATRLNHRGEADSLVAYLDRGG